MTRPSNFARTDGDFDFQALLNSREFQEAFNQYPNSNPFPILARYLQDNYNIIVDEGDFESDSDESIEMQTIDDSFEEAYAERFMQALVNGQRERRILPATPPPSPIPNPALDRLFLSAAEPPPLPPRRRSQLSSSMTTSTTATTNVNRYSVPRFTDLNAAEEFKSLHGGFEVCMTPPDRNNELPFTFEFQRRLREQGRFDFPGR